MKPQPVLETLQRLTAGRDDVIWTTGVGQHQMWAMQYLLCDRPRSFITSGGLGTMGYGIPAAIGAKAARPDATVICVDGDGCFQMTQQELATSVLERLPIVVVLINNGHLGMVRQWQDMFFEERFSQIELTQHVPDYAALAEAYGGRGLRRRPGGRSRGDARRGDRLRSHGGRRLPRRRARALLPDHSRRRRGARPRRVPGRAGVGVQHEAHTGRPRREQAGCARADLEHVRAPRLQHREPRRRDDRTAGDLARHAPGRLRRHVPRPDREADAQARQRAPDHGAHAWRLDRARARADQGHRPARAPDGADGARRGLPGPRRRPRPGRRSSSSSRARPRRSTRSRSLLRPHGVKELVRTGRVGLSRASSKSTIRRRQLVVR